MSAVGAAKLLYLFVHHVCEGVTASSHMLRQSVGSLVAGLEKEQVKAVLDGKLVSLGNVFLIAASRLHIVDRVVGEGNHVVHAAVLHYHQSGEKLCNTGRRRQLVNSLSKEHSAGICVHCNSNISQNAGTAWPLRSGQSSDAGHQGQLHGKKQGQS